MLSRALCAKNVPSTNDLGAGLKPAPLRGMRLILVIVVVVIIIMVIVNRPQEVLEGPLGHESALPPRCKVRETEVDALVDADVHDIPGQVREATIRARLLDGQWRGATQRKGQVVRSEEERDCSGESTSNIVCAGSVVWIRWGID